MVCRKIRRIDVSMKKWLVPILALLLILAASCAMAADDPVVYTSDSWSYTLLEDGTAEIIGCDSKAQMLTIPSELDGYTVTRLGDKAFSNSRMSVVTIPDSIVSVGTNPFRSCFNLFSFNVSPTHPTLEVIDGVLFEKNEKRLICYPMNLRVDSYAVPEGTVSIGDSAFYNCGALKEVTLPDSLTQIGAYGFYGCYKLSSITLPERMTTIGKAAFEFCDELKSIVIPEHVTHIGDHAFAHCKVLSSVVLPKGLKTLEHSAFWGCKALTSIVIPHGVTTIVGNTFTSCTGLISVEIPESVTSIESWAFSSCSGLTSVVIPSGVTEIGKFAFDGCSSLRSLTVTPGSYAETWAKNNRYTCLYRSADGQVGTATPRPTETPRNTSDTSSFKYKLMGGMAEITDYTGTDAVLTIPSAIDGYRVTKIGDFAFSNCYRLTSVTIPEGVSSIGDYAFSFCEKLTSITLPDSVTYISNSAFSSCTALDALTVTPGSYAETWAQKKGFSCIYGSANTLQASTATPTPPVDTSSYKYKVTGGTAEITDYTGTDTVLTIPSEIDGYRVTKIGGNAFSSCKTLTSVTIPEGVSSIGNKAFSYCYELINITIPEGVSSIGNNAFSFCEKLTSITLPDSLTSIGNGAFYSCDSLTNITLPDSVASIGANPFRDCARLTEINVSPSHPKLSVIDGVLFDHDEQKLICYPGALTADDYAIPQGIRSIGDYAFAYSSSLRSVTIPDSLTSIGNAAFYCSKKLSSVTIPEGVTSIGNEAFFSCDSLTSIIIPEGVTSIGYYAFYSCDSLTSIIIPEGVTSIGHYAFSSCNSLTSITLPDSLTSIGNDAFCNCDALTSITIPDSVTSVGANPFRECTRLTEINVSPNHPKLSVIDGVLFDHDEQRLICYPYAFKAADYTIPQGIRSIGDYAFADSSSLRSVTIPDSVTSIGSNAFYSCGTLTSVTIPDSVTSIGSNAFYFCEALTSVTIPDSVTSIGTWAFSSCPALTSVTVLDGVTKIGMYAFSSCKALTSVTIPASVTSIGSGAFNYCTALDALTVTPGSYAETWAQKNSFACVYAPAEEAATDTAAETAEAVVRPTELTIAELLYRMESDGSVMITGCTTDATYAVIPATLNGAPVTAIKAYAFSDCTGLTRIAIPASVTSISPKAFDGCGLTTVDVIVTGTFDHIEQWCMDKGYDIVLVEPE